MEPGRYGFAESWLLYMYEVLVREQDRQHYEHNKRKTGRPSKILPIENKSILGLLRAYQPILAKYLALDHDAAKDLDLWMESRLQYVNNNRT